MSVVSDSLSAAVKMNRWQLVGHSSGHASSPSWQPSCLHNHFDTSSEEVQAQVMTRLISCSTAFSAPSSCILLEKVLHHHTVTQAHPHSHTHTSIPSHHHVPSQSLRECEEQVEGLVAHVTDLRSEMSLLRDHVTSHHTHNNNILVKDLVREGDVRRGGMQGRKV